MPGEAPIDLMTLPLESLKALARYLAVSVPNAPVADSNALRTTLIQAIRSLPTPIGQRSNYTGKRVVREFRYRNGDNPRRAGSHGHNAFNLIPTDDFGIRAEDLLARIALLPMKSSPTYGAGGTNHLTYDLSRGFTQLIDDPPPPVRLEQELGRFATAASRGRVQAQPRFAVDIAEPGPASRVQCITMRIVRDTEVVRWLKTAHADRCQLCGHTVSGPSGWTYSEGHHLHPLGTPHNGPDVAANIVILCPNHHAMCDYGAIALNAGDLRLHADHHVGEEYLGYHNRLVAIANR